MQSSDTSNTNVVRMKTVLKTKQTGSSGDIFSGSIHGTNNIINLSGKGKIITLPPRKKQENIEDRGQAAVDSCCMMYNGELQGGGKQLAVDPTIEETCDNMQDRDQTTAAMDSQLKINHGKLQGRVNHEQIILDPSGEEKRINIEDKDQTDVIDAQHKMNYGESQGRVEQITLDPPNKGNLASMQAKCQTVAVNSKDKINHHDGKLQDGETADPPSKENLDGMQDRGQTIAIDSYNKRTCGKVLDRVENDTVNSTNEKELESLHDRSKQNTIKSNSEGSTFSKLNKNQSTKKINGDKCRYNWVHRVLNQMNTLKCVYIVPLMSILLYGAAALPSNRMGMENIQNVSYIHGKVMLTCQRPISTASIGTWSFDYKGNYTWVSDCVWNPAVCSPSTKTVLGMKMVASFNEDNMSMTLRISNITSKSPKIWNCKQQGSESNKQYRLVDGYYYDDVTTPSPNTREDEPSSGSNTIYYIAAGAGLAIILVAVIVVCICRKRNRQRQRLPQGNTAGQLVPLHASGNMNHHEMATNQRANGTIHNGSAL